MTAWERILVRAVAVMVAAAVAGCQAHAVAWWKAGGTEATRIPSIIKLTDQPAPRVPQQRRRDPDMNSPHQPARRPQHRLNPAPAG